MSIVNVEHHGVSFAATFDEGFQHRVGAKPDLVTFLHGLECCDANKKLEKLDNRIFSDNHELVEDTCITLNLDEVVSGGPALLNPTRLNVFAGIPSFQAWPQRSAHV